MIVRARDVYGEPLPSPFTVTIEPLGAPASGGLVARDVPPDGQAELEVSRSGFYRVRVVSEGHAEVSRNVGGSIEELELLVPIAPSAVVGFTWPAEPGPFPGVDFAELDDVRRGALLNIWVKLWTLCFGVTPAATYVEEILEVRVDRLICRVSPAIVEQLEDGLEADELRKVSSAVGHDPPAGYERGLSVKTRERVGGLQISLFEACDLVTSLEGGELLADVDIDEEAGFPHVVRAIGHHLTGGKTDPIEVQQLLVAQGLDPGWRPLIS